MKKTTILIPCYYGHIDHLFKTIDCFVKGTIKPYQILISLNGCKYINKTKIDKLQELYSKHFEHFDIIKSNEPMISPVARNFVYKYIKGDIISLCDADDIQHPQKVEIVEYFFNNYDIEHLMNGYILSECFKNNNNNHCFLCKNNYKRQFEKYYLENINFMDTKEVYNLNYFNDNIQPGVKTVLAFYNKKQILPTHGTCHFTKKVFDKIKFNELYPRGQDSLFCQEVLKTFKKTMIIDANLIIYVNGWVPQKNDFYKFNSKYGDIYMNLGAPIPPPPGKPRDISEYTFIQNYLSSY